MLKIGIISEGKNPPDARVPLTPRQVSKLSEDKHLDIIIQPSSVRAFKDEEYKKAGAKISDNMSDRDVLLGVKEVPVSELIDNKTYFFFSHTIKEQPYNQPLLKACIEKKIRLIDYEVITNKKGQRVIAFGKFAGMVGAHNAIWTWGKRTEKLSLPRMHNLSEYTEAQSIYSKIKMPSVKIVVTGTGRVASGSVQVLENMGIRRVDPLSFLTENYEDAVYTQLSPLHYVKKKDGSVFENLSEFFTYPERFENNFRPFLPHTDILINGIFWDNRSPAFFTIEDMTDPRFNIQVIADITCDIAPASSIPSTLRASTIENPVFGFDPFLNAETPPYQENFVDMMTIDNLPNELPRDASKAFGEMFIQEVLPELLTPYSPMLHRATICENGDLTSEFEYLRNYVEKKTSG